MLDWKQCEAKKRTRRERAHIISDDIMYTHPSPLQAMNSVNTAITRV